MATDAHTHAGPSIPRRKRVTIACDSCRLRKTKCDTRRPVCGRCAGYGFRCSWSHSRSHSHSLSHSPDDLPPKDAELLAEQDARKLVNRYRRSVTSVCAALPDEDRAQVAELLARIQDHVDAALRRRDGASMTTAPDASNGEDAEGLKPATPASTHGPRYLGEVSDIHFFNLAKRTFQLRAVHALPDQVDESVDSYDQETGSSSPSPSPCPSRDVLLDVPAHEQGERYLAAYFETIHIAYPFIPKSSFMHNYHHMFDDGSDLKRDSAWLARLYAVLAIGSYYKSFTAELTRTKLPHQTYFQRSVRLSELNGPQRSITHVSTLLVQCFYLLAVSRTDACWTVLGVAIRLGQSIGLHTEAGASATAETRRRLWYSLYVLDRLVALQLGRPPAISDEDCNTSMPSRTSDAEHDWDSGDLPLTAPGEPSVGDYFLCLIRFSSIVGRVLREIYDPRQDIAAKLIRTKSCDEMLLAWRQGLPRVLRFDIGHAFEKSVPFRRQRNMLAIKFHHLRALMHRPYLRLTLLRGSAADASPYQQYQLQEHEEICISEAQSTARLLHNVADEADLVHEFPYWQMISCLVCAGSILIVASASMKLADDRGGSSSSFGSDALEHDAEICLKAFEALSCNSDGASMARDMLRRLRSQLPGAQSTNATNVISMPRLLMDGPAALPHHYSPTSGVSPPPASSFPEHLASGLGAGSDPLQVEDMPFMLHPHQYSHQSNVWPLEISDSMIWTTQFFDRIHGPSDGPSESEAPRDVS